MMTAKGERLFEDYLVLMIPSHIGRGTLDLLRTPENTPGGCCYTGRHASLRRNRLAVFA